MIVKEGVSFHAFADSSGCSFYNHNTGETISIEVALGQLLDYYHSLNNMNLPKAEIYVFLERLVLSGFICAPRRSDT